MVLDRDTNEKGVGEHDEGKMTRSAEETAHVVLIQAQICAGISIFFDAPPGPNGWHDDGQGRGKRSEDQGGGEHAGIIETATHGQDVVPVSWPAWSQGRMAQSQSRSPVVLWLSCCQSRRRC